MRPFSDYTEAAEKTLWDFGVILIATPIIIVMAPYHFLRGLWSVFRLVPTLIKAALVLRRQDRRG
jgi:hypothetical protein